MSVLGNAQLLMTPEGYQISRSVRLRSSASAYFNRTPASAGNRQKFTISSWVKTAVHTDGAESWFQLLNDSNWIGNMFILQESGTAGNDSTRIKFTVNNWNATAWATSSGGGVADTNYPLPQDTAIIENTGLTAGNTITINGAWNISTLDTSTRTNAMTLASGTTTPTFYGNFTYGSGVTPTGTGLYTFSNRSTKTLNSGGITFTQPVLINAPGGGIQLLTNNLTLGTTLTTTLTQGTLDLNNLTLTTGLFSSSNNNVRTIAFGTGNISCSGTGTVWNTATESNLTTTGTQVVNVTSAGSTAITVNSGSQSEANSISFNFTGGTYALTFLASSLYTARNVNFTGYAGTWQAIALQASIYGNLTL